MARPRLPGGRSFDSAQDPSASVERAPSGSDRTAIEAGRPTRCFPLSRFRYLAGVEGNSDSW
jgi:hypothetical protein